MEREHGQGLPFWITSPVDLHCEHQVLAAARDNGSWLWVCCRIAQVCRAQAARLPFFNVDFPESFRLPVWFPKVLKLKPTFTTRSSRFWKMFATCFAIGFPAPLGPNPVGLQNCRRWMDSLHSFAFGSGESQRFLQNLAGNVVACSATIAVLEA